MNTQGREVVAFGTLMTSIKYGTSQPPVFAENGAYKFIRATNIKSGRITEVDMLRIDEKAAEKLEKCKLCGNEIIIVRSGANTGDTCVVTTEYANQYAGYDIIVSLDLCRCNPVYYNELLNTHYMQQVVKPLTVRSAQPHINAQQVQDLPMLVATLNEQNEFAAFVEQSDKSKFIRFKSQFIEMFGDPNNNANTVSFETAFTIRDDLRKPINDSVRSEMHENAMYPYYGANGQVDTINQYLMDCTALCLAEDCGAYGAGEASSYIVSGKCWVNNHAHVIIPKECCDLHYANAFFKILDMTPYVSGSTRLKLTQGKMKEIPVVLPSIGEQMKFAAIVEQSDKSKFQGVKR